VFVNSEPMREEQIQNAVKFLSHPKVRGSPVIHRRSFLEKKGLTKEEIDEAFRRVPVCFFVDLLLNFLLYMHEYNQLIDYHLIVFSSVVILIFNLNLRIQLPVCRQLV